MPVPYAKPGEIWTTPTRAFMRPALPFQSSLFHDVGVEETG
jgi:hypothetical protein